MFIGEWVNTRTVNAYGLSDIRYQRTLKAGSEQVFAVREDRDRGGL